MYRAHARSEWSAALALSFTQEQPPSRYTRTRPRRRNRRHLRDNEDGDGPAQSKQQLTVRTDLTPVFFAVPKLAAPSRQDAVEVARMQHAPKTHGPGHRAWIDTPGEKLHIDLAGPTGPTLNDDHYVLVGFDEGSEYLKALPLRDKTPVEVKRVYIRGYGGERRPAKVIRCDNGGEFQREFREYITSQGTHVENSLAGRPSTNSRIKDKVR